MSGGINMNKNSVSLDKLLIVGFSNAGILMRSAKNTHVSKLVCGEGILGERKLPAWKRRGTTALEKWKKLMPIQPR
jgi:hypothetical protein